MKDKTGKLLNIIILIMTGVIIYASLPSSEPPPVLLPEASAEKVFIELEDPAQNRYKGDDFIPVTDKNMSLEIHPKANYRIYAMVMSKKKYSWGWGGKVAPYDLALAWNKLMLPENQVGIKYSQSGRWYQFRYDSGFPLTKSYIYKHSANTHCIPANQTVKKGLDRIRRKNKVYMEGYLVNIKGKVENSPVWWNSSISRNDTGDGSCEVFYIKKIVLDNEIYE